MKNIAIAAFLTLMLASGISYALDDYENLIALLDERFDGKPSLDEETIVDEEKTKTILELRKNAVESHNAGRHEEAVEMLETAIELVDNLDSA